MALSGTHQPMIHYMMHNPGYFLVSQGQIKTLKWLIMIILYYKVSECDSLSCLDSEFLNRYDIDDFNCVLDGIVGWMEGKPCTIISFAIV
jgi:hypothetical protein